MNEKQIEEQIDKIYSIPVKINIIEQTKEEKKDHVNPLYGEMTRKGAEAIFWKLKGHFFNPAGVFYDLGSGQGKLTMHSALRSRLRKIVGVEYYKERVDTARSLSQQVDYPWVTPEFVQGNIFDMDFSTLAAALNSPIC